MGQILKELYNPEDSTHDGIACDIIASMLEIPGVSEAVMAAFLKDHRCTSLAWLRREWNVENVEDIPFQFVWDYIFNSGLVWAKGGPKHTT